MSNWFKDFLSDPFGTVGGTVSNLFDDVDLGYLASLGGSLAYQSGALDPVLEKLGLDFATQAANAPQQTGYLGGIPDYVAVQERVPQSGIAAPRPGASGQRYFSDVIYAQKPAGMQPPTLEEARAMAQAQAAGIAGLAPPAGAAPVSTTGGSIRPAVGGTNTMGVPNVRPNRPAGGSGTGTGTLDEARPELRAAGGLLGLAKGGYYLGGTTDGMADKVPARIDGGQEARLSDGEFVVPADVVSHLGNGNSNAGAQQLYAMMDKVRQERTGRKEQGRQINPKRFMPGMGA